MQHLDEGTIHAWLDGALAPNEGNAAEAHVQACEQCARAVAEARGLVAASSRILAALDDVPAVKQTAGDVLTMPVARRRRGGSWWRRAAVGYAAAATALLAVGTTLVLRSVSPDAAMDRAAVVMDESAPAAPTAATQAVIDSVASARRVATPPQISANAASEGSGAQLSSVARSKNAKEPEAKEEELSTDRVVQLPGVMPRPMTPTPPPSVRQEERKSMADLAADAAVPVRGAVVQGRVLDAATGAPVVGATVSVDTARAIARTDSAGKFQLQAVPSGQQIVRVRALGFQPAQHQLQVALRDSVDLGFALQRGNFPLQDVVVTGAEKQVQDAQQRGQAGAARAREERRQDSLATKARAASPVLRLDGIRANAENILGCYTLRAVADTPRDAERSVIASMPARVELELKSVERAHREEPLVNRARTLAGAGRAESWRFVGDSLELAWMDGTKRNTLRFARRDVRWVAELAVMEPCQVR